METQPNPVNARLRLSGGLIVLGLVVQALSLLWNHPLSFIAFVGLGGLLVVAGIVIYLFTLVGLSTANTEKTGDGDAKVQARS